jgi:hypothetical protein
MGNGINYSILLIAIMMIILSILSIQYFSLDKNNTNKLVNSEETENVIRTLMPIISIFGFFIGCYFVSLIVENPNSTLDTYSGIIYLLLIAVILLYMNATSLNSDLIREYIKGKKFSSLGVLIVIGIGSILFGFIDNFGMKLGTEALDDIFLQGFLSPFSRDTRFMEHKDNIAKNLKIMNKWASNDWAKVINHTLRFRDEISKNKKMKDLMNAINSFDCTKLDIPKDILKSASLTNDYVDNIRSQYVVIDGSKSMMGNTFSNLCAALLAAGILNLFIYLTAFDEGFTGDESIDDNFFVKNRNVIAPVIEAIGIVIGCLIPIFLNIAMKRNNFNNNTRYAWVIILMVAIFMGIMMYLGSNTIQVMTNDDKRNGLKKTLNELRERYDINSRNKTDAELDEKVKQFISKL